jgi:serine/threonine-protein kinase
MIPQKIGRYEVEAELGRGGMATVYRAYDPRFKREVAVKVLPREFLHDPQFRTRFEREAQTIAALEHPAIVPVYDFGEEEGQPYIVMRLMTGGSLAERLVKGPLPLAEAARIFHQLASALDKAHARGMIHRDLKPGNILFDADGNPCISDFGIVKLTEATATFTGTGVVGTPAYMSPEQARGDRSLDGRSDIYALGAILFQMLTGRLPYEADTPMGIAIKHLTEPTPRILAAKPDLPPACEDVIQRAMAKNRDERYPTANGLAEALATLAGGAAQRPAIPGVAEAPAPETQAAVGEGAALPLTRPEEPEQLITPARAKPVLAPTMARRQPAARARRWGWVLAGVIGLGGAALGAALWLGRGETPPPAGPTATGTATPTVTRTRAPTLTSTFTSTPLPTATPTVRPSATPIPRPAWVADFAEPILTAIAKRTPDFEDDFSTDNGGWSFGVSHQPEQGLLLIQNGRLRLYLTGTGVQVGHAEHQAARFSDIVLTVDAMLEAGSGDWAGIAWRGGDPGSLGVEFSADAGDWSLGACYGSCQTLSSGRIPDFSLTGWAPVTVIAKGTEYAVYVNDSPLTYVDDVDRPAGSRISLYVWSGTQSDVTILSFDNVRIWDLGQSGP